MFFKYVRSSHKGEGKCSLTICLYLFPSKRYMFFLREGENLKNVFTISMGFGGSLERTLVITNYPIP